MAAGLGAGGAFAAFFLRGISGGAVRFFNASMKSRSWPLGCGASGGSGTKLAGTEAGSAASGCSGRADALSSVSGSPAARRRPSKVAGVGSREAARPALRLGSGASNSSRQPAIRCGRCPISTRKAWSMASRKVLR